MCNEDNINSCNDINEDMDDVEIIIGSILSNEERSGLVMVYDSGEGSKMNIVYNINDYKSLDTCKLPTMLKEGFNLSNESIPASDNYDSEAKNDCAT